MLLLTSLIALCFLSAPGALMCFMAYRTYRKIDQRQEDMDKYEKQRDKLTESLRATSERRWEEAEERWDEAKQLRDDAARIMGYDSKKAQVLSIVPTEKE